MQQLKLSEARQLLANNNGKNEKIAIFTTPNPWVNAYDKPITSITKQEKIVNYPKPGYILVRNDGKEDYSLVAHENSNLYVSFNYPTEISTNATTYHMLKSLTNLFTIKDNALVFLFRRQYIDVNQEIRELRASIDMLIKRGDVNLTLYYNVLTDYIKQQDSVTALDVENIYDVLASLKETLEHINRKVAEPATDIRDFIQ